MSYGICICSKCKREADQSRTVPGDFNSALVWHHCEDGAPLCKGANSAYPQSNDEIVGEWCGRDGGNDDR